MASERRDGSDSVGDGADDWHAVGPLVVDMLTSLQHISDLRGRKILSQLIALAKAEAQRQEQ